MERIDSIHSISSSTTTDESKPPKPILINTPPTPSHHHHQSRRSISGIDILNGLKIMTSSVANTHNTDSIPVSPVPSSAHPSSSVISEHQFSQIDDFDIEEAIGIVYY